MNLKDMVASVITAMVVVAMFASSAAAINYEIGKSTLTEPGGTVDNSLEYVIGQQVNYSMTFKPTSENCTITSAKDVFPDGTESSLPGSYPISLNKDELIGWETTWIVVPGGIVNGKIVNKLVIEGKDEDGNDFMAIAPKSSKITVTVGFTYRATGCMELTFDPTYSGHVAWHQWIIEGHTYPVVFTPPVSKTHTFTTCDGPKIVTLKGGSDPGNLANCDTFTDTVYVACEPIVKVERTPPTGCVDVGDSVTFSITSLTNDTPIDTYEWTFTNGVSGSGVHTWPADGNVSITRAIPASGTTATLKVTDDLGCKGTGIASVGICVEKPPSEVPILTPAGMLALIGLLGIVGGSRILRKGRRS